MTKKEKNNRDLKNKEIVQKNPQTLFYVFIPSISAKNRQAVNVFLKEKNFKKTLNTKKKRNLIYTHLSANANYILENNQMISEKEIQKIIKSLMEHFILINGVVWNGQIINHLDQFASVCQWKQQPLIPRLVL